MRKLHLLLLLVLLFTALPLVAQDDAPTVPVVKNRYPININFQQERGRIAWSPDGVHFVTSARYDQSNDVIQLWDAEAGQEVAAMLFPNRVAAVAFNADGSLLALAGGQYFVMVVDVQEFLARQSVPIEELMAQTADTGLIRNLVGKAPATGWISYRWVGFSADSQTLIAADNFTVSFWDISAPNFTSLSDQNDAPHQTILDPQIHTFMPIRIAEDGLHAFSSETDQGFAYVTLRPDAVAADVLESATTFGDLLVSRFFDVSSDGSTLIQYNESGLVAAFAQTGETKVVPVIEDPLNMPLDFTALALNHDGTRVVAAGGGRIRIYDTLSGETLVDNNYADLGTVVGVLVSPTNDKLLMVFSGRVEIWDISMVH